MSQIGGCVDRFLILCVTLSDSVRCQFGQRNLSEFIFSDDE